MFLGGCEAAGLLVAVRADCGKAGGSVLSPAFPHEHGLFIFGRAGHEMFD